MEKAKVKSYVSRKGKQVRGHVRRKKKRTVTDRFKDYSAKALLAGAAYETFGRPSVSLVKSGQKQLAKRGVKLTTDLSKKAPILSKFLPVGIAAYYGTTQGMKAIGWSVGRRKKREHEKIKSKYRIMI